MSIDPDGCQPKAQGSLKPLAVQTRGSAARCLGETEMDAQASIVVGIFQRAPETTAELLQVLCSAAADVQEWHADAVICDDECGSAPKQEPE